MTKDEALKLALEALVAYGNKHRATYLLSGAWDAEITLGDATITTIKEALAQPDERDFCPRCGKRTADLTTIHTCTPPIAAGSQAFYGFPQGSVSTPNAGGKCVTAGETAPKEST